MNEDVFKGKISEDFYKNTVNDGRYDDIIDMAHHVSKDRPHMSVQIMLRQNLHLARQLQSKKKRQH